MKGLPTELVYVLLFGAALLFNVVMQRAAKRRQREAARNEPSQDEPSPEEIPEEVWGRTPQTRVVMRGAGGGGRAGASGSRAGRVPGASRASLRQAIAVRGPARRAGRLRRRGDSGALPRRRAARHPVALAAWARPHSRAGEALPCTVHRALRASDPSAASKATCATHYYSIIVELWKNRMQSPR